MHRRRDLVCPTLVASVARALSAFALALGVASGPADASAAPERGTPPAPGVPKGAIFKALRSEVERDLVLELRRTNSEPFEAHQEPHLEVRLVNRSRTRGYPVVLSSDGSEAGWREPHAWFTLERQTASGAWEDAPEPAGGRCGNYDEDWTKDVVRLAPGAARELAWYRFPTHADLGDSKKVRVVAHYAYSEGAVDKRKPPPSLAAMPSFELASAPLELDVTRPLALELVLRGPLPHLGGAPLAPALDVRVQNLGPQPLPFATADVASLSFDAELERTSDSVKTRTIRIDTDHGSPGNARDVIASGQRRSVLLPTTKTSAHDGFGLVPPGERVARLRARYDLAFENAHGPNQRVLVSPWVPVPQAFRPRFLPTR